jgi:hypothetical protein
VIGRAMTSQSYWEVKRGDTTYFVGIEPQQVTFGDFFGSGHAANTGICSHTEFMAGLWHDDIKAHMGADVLAEVRAAVAFRLAEGRR